MIVQTNDCRTLTQINIASGRFFMDYPLPNLVYHLLHRQLGVTLYDSLTCEGGYDARKYVVTVVCFYHCFCAYSWAVNVEILTDPTGVYRDTDVAV